MRPGTPLVEKLRIVVILITLSLLWGSSFLAIKITVDAIQPILVFGVRFVLAGLILLAAHYMMSLLHYSSKNDKSGNYYSNEVKKSRFWKDSLILGVFLIVGGQGLLAWGTQYLSSGVSALINSTIPLWVAIFTLIFFGKRPTKMSTAGLIAGFGGLVILVLPSLLDAEVNLAGIISLILSSVFWALGSIYSNSRRLTKPHVDNIFVPTGIFMAVGGAILLIISGIANNVAIEEFRVEVVQLFTGNVLMAFLFLTLVCTVVGYAEFYWLLRTTTASLANTFAYVVPVIAIILGWVILHEVMTSQTVIATCIILIGVALMIVKSPSETVSTTKDSTQNW
jgi:drug/metabolite transporter (DMT)-like permease